VINERKYKLISCFCQRFYLLLLLFSLCSDHNTNNSTTAGDAVNTHNTHIRESNNNTTPIITTNNNTTPISTISNSDDDTQATNSNIDDDTQTTNSNSNINNDMRSTNRNNNINDHVQDTAQLQQLAEAQRCNDILKAYFDKRVTVNLKGVFEQKVNELATIEVGKASEATSVKLESRNAVRFGRHHQRQIPNPLRSEPLKVLAAALLTAHNKRERVTPEVHALFKFIRESYINEKMKVDTILDPLKSLLGLPNVKIGEAQNKKAKDRESDLKAGRMDVYAFLEGLGIPLCILEAKNEENSASKSEATSQALVYFLQWFRTKQHLVVNNWPCVILCICGTVLTVRSVVFTDCTYGDCRLVETCMHTLNVSDPNSIHELANIMAAVRNCLASLAEMHLTCVRAAVAAVNTAITADKFLSDCSRYMFPACNELTCLNLCFSYYAVVQAGKRVFRAVVNSTSQCQLSDQKLIVKFVDGSYCDQLHLFLAQRDMAPQLYGVQELGYRDWKMIVMADKTPDWQEQVAATALTQKHKDLELQLLTTMHTAGFVHGDFRFGNLLYTREPPKVLLIDFDWAGRPGDAAASPRYPVDIDLTAGIAWHEDVSGGVAILPQHDMHLFTKRYDTLDVDELNVIELTIDDGN
jgi:hypothetical protein